MNDPAARLIERLEQAGSRVIAAELRREQGWRTTRETVNRACAWLKAHGWLDWHQERAPGSKWRHNVYRLRCAWVRPLRRELLRRLDTLKNCFQPANNNYFPTPGPFSVTSPPGLAAAGPAVGDFGRVLAEHARAGP